MTTTGHVGDGDDEMVPVTRGTLQRWALMLEHGDDGPATIAFAATVAEAIRAALSPTTTTQERDTP